MVLTNPKKINHTQAFMTETVSRTENYRAMHRLVVEGQSDKAMAQLGFTDEKLYIQFRRAFYLAYIAHRGQLDKAGVDYICHPAAVVRILAQREKPSKKRDRAMVAAMLHDILEDTDVTANALSDFGFDERIVTTVALLSRAHGQDYDDYLRQMEKFELALMVKCGDLSDNEKLSRIEQPVARDLKRSAFYHKRKLLLEEKLRQLRAEKKSAKKDKKKGKA